MTSPIDWEGIEADYRAGQLSNRKIAETYGCSESTIRSRAKKEGWKKDLAEKVKKGIKAEITKKAADKAKREEPGEPKTDDQIVADAVETGVAIIEAHQQRIGLYQSVASKLGNLLKSQVEKGKLKVQVKSGDIVEIDLDLEYVSKTLNGATNALDRLIKLERQAHNLNEGTDSEYEQALKELADGL